MHLAASYLVPEGAVDPHDGTVELMRFAMDAGDRFGRHRHAEHQLTWTPDSVLHAEADGSTWVLPPTLALWIPGQIDHDVLATKTATFHSLYISPPAALRSSLPATVTPVAVTPLLRELMRHLLDADLAPAERRRAEAVVYDAVRPAVRHAIALPMPQDDRARRVADGILDEPDSSRTIDHWGSTVGASGRTLTRLFHAETGMSFGDWRTRARVAIAAEQLGAGAAVSAAAHSVGYQDVSSFIAAFRRVTDTTPGAFLRAFEG